MYTDLFDSKTANEIVSYLEKKNNNIRSNYLRGFKCFC